MVLGIEFLKTKVGGKTYIRVAPYHDGLTNKTTINIKAILVFVFLMSAVVAIGKAYQQ